MCKIEAVVNIIVPMYNIYVILFTVLVIGFDRATLTVHEGDHECSPSVRVCAQISNVILGLPLLMVPVWRAGTAAGN